VVALRVRFPSSLRAPSSHDHDGKKMNSREDTVRSLVSTPVCIFDNEPFDAEVAKSLSLKQCWSPFQRTPVEFYGDSHCEVLASLPSYIGDINDLCDKSQSNLRGLIKI